MIPLNLQIKNFLSYGPDLQTIDLSAYPLICLSGKNGHGKSALLDAITWALWGQARKVSGNAKADQGLLRLGQTQMMVSLDFEFNGHIYRVRREFAVTYGKPYAALDFGLVNADNSFIPLTDKTISKSQEIIEQTLNLSYDSFSNSAFLRQGQSNEFSKKSPKDRKEILATILGLDQYENVRKLAMEKIRQAQTDKATRTSMQEKITQELQKKESLLTQLIDAEKQLAALATQERLIAEQKKAQAEYQTKLFEDKKNYQVLSFHLQQLNQKDSEYQKLIQKNMGEWKSIHRKQLKLPNPTLLETEKQKLMAALKEQQTALQKNLELKEVYLKHKEEAQQLVHKLKEQQATILNQKKVAVERLLIEQQTIEQTLNDITKRVHEHEREKTQNNATIEKLNVTLTTQEATLKKYYDLEKHFERRKEYYQKFLETGKWLTAELENLQQKKELVHDDDDPSCPLCEQNLTAARKRFLKQKFSDTEKFLRHRLARISNVVKKLKNILIDQHKELETSKKLIEQATTLHVQNEELIKNITKITFTIDELLKGKRAHEKKLQDLAKLIIDEQALLTELIKQETIFIEQHHEYISFKKTLNSLEDEAKKINYNQENHKKINEQLQLIEQQLAEYYELLQEITLQTQRQKTISELIEQLKRVRNEKKDIETSCIAYTNLTERQHVFDQQERMIQTAIQKLTTEKEQLLEQKTRLEMQKTIFENLEKEYQEHQNMITSLQEMVYDYQAIAAATGKDGIQALLIEEAIPEIEQEANHLLSRLTNNQAQVFFESLRDLKKGGSKETLDIKISDAAGIRPYELFSGGEAFRIDFALRIAISKLLARRAGTSLQTLIIDEGFGSQDEEGLSLIMDALYKIQDDFSKIIIVSHLPSMKDQFPVHFFIEKGPNGSTVSVIEQG